MLPTPLKDWYDWSSAWFTVHVSQRNKTIWLSQFWGMDLFSSDALAALLASAAVAGRAVLRNRANTPDLLESYAALGG